MDACEDFLVLPTLGQIVERSACMRTLAQLCFPVQCCCCGTHGSLLCEACARQVCRIDPIFACPYCGAPFGALICTECSVHPAFRLGTAHVGVATLFTPESAALIRTYKDKLDRRLVPLIADYLVEAFMAYGFDRIPLTLMTTVPPRQEALHERGFDHAALVARVLSARLALPYRQLLCMLDVHDQRGLSHDARAQNMAHAFAYDVTQHVTSQDHILIVDDVITTGATVRASVETLRQATGAQVSVLAFARVYGSAAPQIKKE